MRSKIFETIGFIILISCISLNTEAQYFSIDTIKGSSPFNQQFSFVFPWIKGGADQSVPDQITSDLVSDVLSIEWGKQKVSIFENVWGRQAMDLPKVGDISFRILNNDEGCLSLSITATTCDGSCEKWTRFYNYESKTGRKIQLGDLFLGIGLQEISDTVNALRNERIRLHCDTLSLYLRQGALSDEDKRDYKKAIELFSIKVGSKESCNIFSIAGNALIVHSKPVLPPELFYIDQLNRDYYFSIASMSDYFSEFGKKLFHL